MKAWPDPDDDTGRWFIVRKLTLRGYKYARVWWDGDWLNPFTWWGAHKEEGRCGDDIDSTIKKCIITRELKKREADRKASKQRYLKMREARWSKHPPRTGKQLGASVGTPLMAEDLTL